ncbi:nucleoside transporter C-terminal domain-containing protein [Sphingomonas sp. BGYR3]|uniref:NupC/NupG family nucleoside CNT transporter n=1 Tax=Sphingomonas sp. BGYR3 TaxID=2975483 RepID=UPI0021A515C9|nr:nucleoside transporter C-terminal domain-containing protein [Sphingomonas sp. BGYR3]MDG5487903.1 nucleoside transporter C-terminal domain-containing protein [Sphingomonas sp. BGYR3]
MNRYLIGIAGIIAILAIAYLFSTNRRAIRLRVVGAAFALQAGVAVLVIYFEPGRQFIAALSTGVSALLGYAGAGTRIILGGLATDPVFSNSFAISAIPAIIFFAALVAVLYHLGIMQLIVKWIGGAIEKVTGVSRVESLCAAANIFVGQSESPLVIRPYLAALSPSQMFAVMSVGMAGVAGTILAAYVGMLGSGSLPFLLAAAFMSAPGGLLMAKMIMPDEPAEAVAHAEGDPVIAVEGAGEHERASNIIMAAAMGAETGVRIAVAVAALVLAFVALVALANGILSGVGGWFGIEGLTFQRILGVLLAPVAFLINIPWAEASTAGGLLGTKVVLNEFVAFADLGTATGLSERSRAIITFALCGFANFSSIAIQMASAGNLAPNQRPVIAKLGLRALLAGTLANLMSAALAGILLP